MTTDMRLRGGVSDARGTAMTIRINHRMGKQASPPLIFAQ